MPAAYPKPDGQKVTRHAPKFDWVSLPASGRSGPAPKLPSLRKWRKVTRDAWADLWSSPQAFAWDQSGRTLHGWALAHHDAITAEENGRSATASLAELRAIEDRHGLNPKAMLQLRWRVVDTEGEIVTSVPEISKGRTSARGRLTVVD